jgi:hypothetical protein
VWQPTCVKVMPAKQATKAKAKAPRGKAKAPAATIMNKQRPGPLAMLMIPKPAANSEASWVGDAIALCLLCA